MTLLGVRMAWVAGLWLAVGVGGLVPSVQAQSVAATAPATVQGVLLEMASHAGVIFSGLVVGITRADAAGYVDVRFRVEHAVRGVATTGAYVLREWAGLWSGGDRYFVGKRYLMLLTARGPSGMSAPVDGLDGAIPLVAGGAAAVMDAHGNVAPDGPAGPDGAPEWRVDVRWLNARAARGVASSSAPRDIQPMRMMVPGGVGSPAPENPLPVALEPRWVAGPARDWVGPIAPLGLAGAAPLPGGAVAGLPLSSILATLQGGVGGVHVSQ